MGDALGYLEELTVFPVQLYSPKPTLTDVCKVLGHKTRTDSDPAYSPVVRTKNLRYRANPMSDATRRKGNPMKHQSLHSSAPNAFGLPLAMVAVISSLIPGPEDG
ncbi:uncharacterized protein AAES06_014860 isoform 2-T2 [Glossophaga mutica]